LRELLECEDVEAMRTKWQLRSLEDRELNWHHVMRVALQYAPERAHQVLEATFEVGVSMPYAIMDSMVFFHNWASILPVERRPQYETELHGLVFHMLRNSPRRYINLYQNTIFRLIKSIDPRGAAELFRMLHDCHFISRFTRLQFISKLAKDTRCKMLALEILRDMVHAGRLKVHDRIAVTLYTSIMSFPRKSLEDRNNAELSTQLYEGILELGLTPNLAHYTTIILNMFRAGQSRTAWHIYSLMREQGIEPDAHLHSVLLTGSKRATTLESIDRIIREVAESKHGDAVIWNDLLHSILLVAIAESKAQQVKPPRVITAFPFMLQAYAKFFDLEPLNRLTPTDLGRHLQDARDVAEANRGQWEWLSDATSLLRAVPDSPTQDLLKPNLDTLLIMLVGYIKGITKAYNIIAFYSHFRQLLKSGDPVAVQFVREKGTILYDMVIKAIMEWPGMLRVSLDVISDMLKDAAAASAAAAAGEDPDSVPRHPAPSVYTWSILLNGFMYHRQHKQGERIIQMMREHGISPNIVTWNTLAAGYARDQNPAKTVSALHRLERYGHTPTDFTSRAFSYLADRERGLQMLEEMVERNKQRE
ncbi:hypothetical protein B0T17DRAFT_466246, partial [Bombardia bombarda]